VKAELRWVEDVPGSGVDAGNKVSCLVNGGKIRWKPTNTAKAPLLPSKVAFSKK
jgi:hypothetical protein